MTATPRPPTPPQPGRIPEALVDRFFDHELDEGSREEFFGMIRGDLARCAEVAKTQRIVSMLREPPRAPDLTHEIMGELRRRRSFIPARARRMIKAGRVAAAACVMLALLCVALTDRYAPGVLRLSSRPAPLSGVIRSGASELAVAVDSVTLRGAALGEGGSPLGSTAGGQARPQRLVLALTPGKTSVKLLPPATAVSALEAPSGSGGEARFVLADGVCIDRQMSRVMSFGLLLPAQPSGEDCSGFWFPVPFSWPAVPSATGAVDSRRWVKVGF